MRLQTKMTLALVPLIVVPLLSLGAMTYLQVRDNAYERTLGQMATLLEQVGEQVRLRASMAASNVGLFANQSLVQKYVLTSNAFERAALLERPLLSQFSQFQSAFPDYSEIRLLNPDGSESIRWTHDPWASQSDALAEAVLERLRVSREASAIFLHESGHTRLIAATAIYLKSTELTSFAAEPQLYGFLSLTVDLGFLTRQLNRHAIADNGTLVVVDASGRPLLSPAHAQYLLEKDKPVPQAVRRVAMAGAAAVVRWNGRSMLVHGTPLAGGAYLLAAVPEAEVLAAGRRVGGQVAVITLFAALLTPLLVLWVLQRLVLDPLRGLAGAADAMGRGELDASVVVRSRDEMGALARRFDQMRENVHHSTQALVHQANHDSLTGLPNRRRLDNHLQQALAETQVDQEHLALLFLDLDGFKIINDNLGHSIGDALLQALSKRLLGCLRRDNDPSTRDDVTGPDLISRVGGDEFVVVAGPLRNANDAGRVADRILAAVREPVEIHGHRLQVAASIGIALCPGDGISAAGLIANADVAMYQAKAQGRNRAVYFSAELGDRFRRRLRLERRLHRAVEHGELELHYQPQVDTFTGRIIGLEALARWTDEQEGKISPAEFIPLAEETGLIVPLTAWVLETACRRNRAWQAEGLAKVPVAVNMPGGEILTGEGVTLIRDALAATGLSPEGLEVEITETTLLSSESRAAEELGLLREMGVGLALDDFGTGYSSLGYLRRLPFQKLKIDRGFVAGVESSDANAAIVSAVIAMAHALDMYVVAEGVEDEPQWRFLAAHRCEAIQGFLFSRPVDAAQAGRLLAQNALSLPSGAVYGGAATIISAGRT